MIGCIMKRYLSIVMGVAIGNIRDKTVKNLEMKCLLRLAMGVAIGCVVFRIVRNC